MPVAIMVVWLGFPLVYACVCPRSKRKTESRWRYSSWQAQECIDPDVRLNVEGWIMISMRFKMGYMSIPLHVFNDLQR